MDKTRCMQYLVFRQNIWTTVRLIAIGSLLIVAWLSVEEALDVRFRISKLLPGYNLSGKNVRPVIYENCTKIPAAPHGTLWPEEKYLHEPVTRDVRDIADPSQSKIWIDGSAVVKLGDTIHVKLQMYDGYGKPRKIGGDLIRVWMRQTSLGAYSNGKVIDNKDGSYSAILTAFWVGQPEIRAAIISPREVIAITLRRRYICPPVLTNTANFEHPVEKTVTEVTPCNYDPQVPGYSTLCNFTEENYGSPWYCGKPSSGRLLCHDWTMVSDRNLWNEGSEQSLLTNVEEQLLSVNYKAMLLPVHLSFTTIHNDAGNQSRLVPKAQCNKASKTLTWSYTSPTGYLYNRKWTNRQCSGNDSYDITQCVRNTKIIHIGDSVSRQMFSSIESLIPCKWITDTWSSSGKHRPVTCTNETLNYSQTWQSHSLPFCTGNTPRHYLKTFNSYFKEMQGDAKMLIIIHAYAHFLNHHSHVFYETLKNMKKGIVDLLSRNPNVQIVIKGPHAFSFAKNAEAVMWMPDKYTDIYTDFIYNEFKDVNDRVMYLESYDVTVSTEQWHIHPEIFVVDAMVRKMFDFIC